MIKNIKLIEVIENMDDYRGKFVHEILFVYFADFKDPDQYNKDFFELIEGGGAEKYIATWISLENFYNDKFRMYPRLFTSYFNSKIAFKYYFAFGFTNG